MENFEIFINPFSKMFYFLILLKKNNEINEAQNHFLKDLIIVENEEIFTALQSYETEKNLDKFKKSFMNLLRFHKPLESIESELSSTSIQNIKRPPNIKVPLCRQLSFYSQIPSPTSKRGSSPTNSPTKSCSPMRMPSRMSVDDIVSWKVIDTFRLNEVKMEEIGEKN